MSAPFAFRRAFRFFFSDHILVPPGPLWAWRDFGHARLTTVFTALILDAFQVIFLGQDAFPFEVKSALDNY
jgi:hypothetical protein